MNERVVDQPEGGPLDREQRNRVVDDVVEQRRKVRPAGDGRGDPAKGAITSDIQPGNGLSRPGTPASVAVLGRRGPDRADT